MGSAQQAIIIGVSAAILSGCGGGVRSIVVPGDGQNLPAAVTDAGGIIIAETRNIGGTVTALLDQEQQEQLLADGAAAVIEIGGVRWRAFLPNGTPLLEYRQGDLDRDGRDLTLPIENQNIIYLLDGKVSDPRALQGPHLHPGQQERCWRHGDLIFDLLAGSIRDARIVSIPVLCDKVDREAVLLAFDWILENHPESARGVINASFTLTDGEDIRRALEAVEARGILVTWAAGNHGKDTCDGNQTPLADSIILVGAGINGDLDPRSNHGPCVDLVTDGSYLRGGMQGWGTSIATPRVSAVLSNLWGSMPGLNGAELRELLLTSATFPHPESGARWMARPQESGWESDTAGS